MDVLIAAGADPAVRNKHGTALDQARGPTVIETLAGAAAEIEHRGEPGGFGTALHNAARGNDATRLKILLRAGADVAAHDDTGSTALHITSLNADNSAEATRILLEAGADPNARDPGGHSPLHYGAIGYEKGENLEALLSAGADTDARARNGNTPLHYAAGYGRDSAVSVLLERGRPERAQRCERNAAPRPRGPLAGRRRCDARRPRAL